MTYPSESSLRNGRQDEQCWIMWAVISLKTYYIIDKYLDPESEEDKEIDGSNSMIIDLIWLKHGPYTIKLSKYYLERF